MVTIENAVGGSVPLVNARRGKKGIKLKWKDKRRKKNPRQKRKLSAPVKTNRKGKTLLETKGLRF